jgi:hypothetical protein
MPAMDEIVRVEPHERRDIGFKVDDPVSHDCLDHVQGMTAIKEAPG